MNMISTIGDAMLRFIRQEGGQVAPVAAALGLLVVVPAAVPTAEFPAAPPPITYGMDAHCMHHEEEGCDDPKGVYTCLVDPGHSHGHAYWPYQSPPDGMQCRMSCPNAHCHSEDPQIDQERLHLLQSRVDEAIASQDLRTLTYLIRSEDMVMINVERRALQLRSECSREMVIAHYLLTPQDFAELRRLSRLALLR